MRAYRWTGTALEPVDWARRVWQRPKPMPPVCLFGNEFPNERVLVELETYERHIVRRESPWFERAVYVLMGRPIEPVILAAFELLDAEERLAAVEEQIATGCARSVGEVLLLGEQRSRLQARVKELREAMEQKKAPPSGESGAGPAAGSPES